MFSTFRSRIRLFAPRRRSFLLPLLAVALAATFAGEAGAIDRSARPAAGAALEPLSSVALFRADTVDPVLAANEDSRRDEEGLPPRFAIPQRTFIAPDTDGTWEDLDQSTRLWRLRISSPGAVSLNLGFTRYDMPPGGELLIYPADRSQPAVGFTHADVRDYHQLWTPVVMTDELVVEVRIPRKAVPQLDLELTSVNVGYRSFGEIVDKSGSCNVDVVCPEGDGWRDEINTVAVISTGGSTFCTGFMVNNTAQDETPYFMTAHHCSITSSNAASLVAYWNFQSPTCGEHGGGSLADFTTGSTLRADYATSDFTLVELSSVPDPSFNVAYAGWDNGSQDPTSACCIHHPNTDEKSISFEYDPLETDTYLGTTPPGDGTHLRVIDWDVGTTEPGSSGSPLFDQNHHVVGQLHGGYAACGNDLSDYYGRFSRSWTGGGSASSRLSDWLDPSGTGVQSLELLAPYATGLRVSPLGGLAAQGDVGGPFTPASQDFVLTNAAEAPIDYSVSADVNWVDVSNGTGTIPVGGNVTVTVGINATAATLAQGVYDGVLSFVNETDHDGDATAPLRLQVGHAAMVYNWDMSADPGWTAQDQWAYGVPTGNGGQYGNPDPTGGANGGAVYGYNLNGDYANNLPERNLTTTAIDCSNLAAVTLKFQRWLNVEQPLYDHAYVRVSNDGVNWTTVWENGTTVTDDAWTPVEYDISAIADGQASVQVRWTMGETDGSWQFSGWNLDEVEIWGLSRGSGTPVGGSPAGARALLLPNVPNPFNPSTEIAFELSVAGRARLSVYDMRGRLVKDLFDGDLPAGRHAEKWDGTDAHGRPVASGSYFFRLTADGETRVRKALLVR